MVAAARWKCGEGAGPAAAAGAAGGSKSAPGQAQPGPRGAV